ncbi:hypothetical protein J2S43_005968 [Catenuloplanes nepalensis]|uniref:Uncharacterized protein n=1 Tax=Catenuloplanes nepalensis TaxID=587533 RepID=A0ABT9N187_9ACTN|nr:hypothetical protein [Catenuloplanes nepalensis]MDP9797456.1 hypothetical protein [Catenuloplanes nepalensis]
MAELTPAQWQLFHDVNGDGEGRDIQDLLLAAHASPEDRAAVADEFGGPGAGASFLDGTATPTSTYENGRIAWAHQTPDATAMTHPEYRRGMQDERTAQVDAGLYAIEDTDC